MGEGSNRYKSFKPSISVTAGQIAAIIFILLVIVSIPLIWAYISNPEKKPIDEIISGVFDSLGASGGEEEWRVRLPVIGSELNLSIFKQNPQLVIFIGIVCIVLAMILAISLIRNTVRNK